MFCCPASASTDSSLRASSHISDAGGRTCPLQARLRQQCSRRHPSLSDAETAVRPQCSGTAHLSPPTFRPQERTEFKIAVLTYKVLCGAAPRYLGPLNRTADMADRRPLRFSATNRLVVPSYRLSSVGSRAFPVAAAKIWNALPDNLVSATSLQTCRRHLKTFLFQRSFS